MLKVLNIYVHLMKILSCFILEFPVNVHAKNTVMEVYVTLTKHQDFLEFENDNVDKFSSNLCYTLAMYVYSWVEFLEHCSKL